ncbi:hypothetical protein RND81_11G027200 [Saponaria officinalis]|uniref:F-box associated beta-propeller type 3 domain-containing protein n=1 Tax=Saponaria officinalis TaxID=3572 RepID=A0AAW1HIW6_SAPOF
MYSFTERKTLRFLKKFDCVPNVPLWVSNSCHGIICFHLSSRSEILLSNPSIQEVVLLPPCPNKGSVRTLGFDPINNDYKVIVFAFNDRANTGNVYSLPEGCWRSLRVNVTLQYDHLLKGRAALNANGRVCNWLGYKVRSEPTSMLPFNMVKDDVLRLPSLVIVSFDMIEEVFNEVPMPECLHPNTQSHELISMSKWQACISCIHRYSICEVWVLNNDRRCSKELVVKHSDQEPMRPLNFLAK